MQRSRKRKAYLYNVGTHVNHRGEGYGTAMTVKLVDEALKYDLGKDDVFIGT
jgi:ribosomal protein S18 acetylase RimI-like enzyme